MNIQPSVTFLIRFTAVAALVALAACADSGNGGPAPSGGVVIDAAGGTVDGPNGAQIVIPAGAVDTATTIAIKQSSAGAPALPAGTAAAGAMYEFTPHGQTFNTPVTISVPFDPASFPAGATFMLIKTANGAAGPWEEVPGATVAGNTLQAQASSFSFTLVIQGDVPPLITVPPADISAVEPGMATFSVTAIGTPPFNYQWERSDDDGASWNTADGVATGRDYTTPGTSVTNDNNDRYRVIVSSLTGNTTSTDALLTVTAALVGPTIVTQPQSTSVAAGGIASFSVVASGSANLTYQWRKDGTPISGQTNASLTLANVQNSNAGVYDVVVSNSVGSVVSDLATLTVGVAPPAGSFTLTVVVTGNGQVRGYPQVGDNYIECGPTTIGNCTQAYPSGMQVSLFALGNAPDVAFNGWGGDCANTQPPFDPLVVMDASKTCTASFSP